MFLGSQTEHVLKAADVTLVLRTLAVNVPERDVTVQIDPDHAWAFARP